MKRADWDLKQHILSEIQKTGGWVNAHTHLDRAYTIRLKDLKLADEHLHKKCRTLDDKLGHPEESLDDSDQHCPSILRLPGAESDFNLCSSLPVCGCPGGEHSENHRFKP